MLRRLIAIGTLTLTGFSAAQQESTDRLPDLGDVTASSFSIQQEHDLGRTWLKMFRGQARTINDPLIQDYSEALLYRIASHSELKDRRLETVVVDNPSINAFAVPGGVVGLHSGLFLHTANEAQFSGVLAHEIAHLSQRHFSRSIDKAKQSSIPTMAGLLAGIILAATTGGDAGMAAIAATQAAALESRLRFSREHEQEADRLGMETLVRSDMDPNAIPAMFEIMNRMARYAGNKPPEFLLTHPLTENRISDSSNRARNYPRKVYTDSINFQLMKMRVTLHHSSNPESLAAKWRNEEGSQGEARRYGAIIALIKLERWQEAQELLAALLTPENTRIAYVLAHAEILIGKKQSEKAIRYLEQQLTIAPNNYPLTIALAQAYESNGGYRDADTLLGAFSRQRPHDPWIWYRLAEVRGLAGNIRGVHQARAEFFILQGRFERASIQLGYAMQLATSDIEKARINQRLKDIAALRVKIEEL